MPDDSRSHVALELTGLIYDSVDDASRWSAFIESFARSIRASRCALLIHDTEADDIGVVRRHGWSDPDIQLYFERYAEADPMRIGSLRALDGDVGADHELHPREEFERSVTFQEFYAPRNCHYSLGGKILTTRTGQSFVTSHRGAEAGPFGEPEKSILRSLMPHLKRAALLHGELGSLRRKLATFTGHLERYPYAFLLIDTERRILYSNAAAREIFSARDGLAADNGRFAPTSPQWEAAFVKSVSESAAGRGPFPRRLEISRPSRRRPYRVILTPIEDSRTIPLGVAVPALSVLVIDPESASGPDPEVLRELFSFTPAEARVSAKLVLGQNAEEIAFESKTSVETVRTHIKRIFSKTATSRQSELVSLILRSTPYP